MSRNTNTLLLSLLVVGGLSMSVSHAGSVARYAFIVGNNHGHNQIMKLPDLKHAEKETRRLRDALIKYGNFDPNRIILTNGATKQGILRAAKRLAALHRRERKSLGDIPTLFAMFFTGHGLMGKLLTADESLDGSDLARIWRDMDASLTVGFFDACFSGSLDLEALRAKGAIRVPGYNPVPELPKELLNAEGVLWFVSSKPEELSYEDKNLGGLFTHFFIESFTQGSEDGIGISLQDMWEYARSRTVDHAARFGRKQTPEKVSNFKSHGPIYFSFAKTRTARLLFDRTLEGVFMLQYEKGGLVEKVTKKAGQETKVPVFHGKILIARVDDFQDTSQPTIELNIARGAMVRIQPKGLQVQAHGAGYTEIPIQSKGQLADLQISRRAPQADFSMGLGYRYSLDNSKTLSAPHLATLSAWYARGPLSMGLVLSYGETRVGFQNWSYWLSEFNLHLNAGFGFDLSGTRLDVEAGAGISFFDMNYSSQVKRRPLGGWVGGGLRYSLDLPFSRPWIRLQAYAALGVRLSEGIASQDQSIYATLAPELGITILLPL